MEKKDLKGYFEFASQLVNFRLNVDLQRLVQAVDETAIHTFGLPIGLVIHTREFEPKPYSQDAIRSVVDNGETFEYWTLDRAGHFYILKSLFEDRRGGGKIFFDTRTIRATEVFVRTANLYRALGAPDSAVMNCSLEYGGLQDRVLTAANPNRAVTMFPERRCSINEVKREFEAPLADFLAPNRLKEMVFDVIKSITEVCDFFVPSKAQVVDPIVEGYLAGRVI